MTIVCDVFSTERALVRPFRFNSGLLVKKEIIQLIFCLHGQPLFVWELALSPSMGETAEQVRRCVENYSQIPMERSASVMLQRACSYAQAAISKRHLLDPRGDGPRISVVTKEAALGPSFCGATIVKYKANRNSALAIAQWSHDSSLPFIVDFNGSLDESVWTRFLGEVDPSAIYYVEQPLPPTHKHTIAGNNYLRIFADELATEATAQQLSEWGYQGLVVKPMRYDYSSFLKVLFDAKKANLDTVLGRMVGDLVESFHLNRLTELCSIHIVDWSSSELESLVEGTGRLTPKNVNALAQYVRQHYRQIGTLTTSLMP